MEPDLDVLVPTYVLEFQPRRQTSIIDWQAFTPFAAWLVDAARPRQFVELGTYQGDSFCAFCQAVADLGVDTRAYAVDTWQGDEHSGSYDPAIHDQLRDYVEPLYGSFARLLRMTFDEAVTSFEDGSIDLLHIDGLHTYDAVRHDFETWRSKLSSSAVVLFHDIAVKERGFGVEAYWRELRKEYLGFEMAYSNGLGLLVLDRERAPAPVVSLCDLPDQRRRHLIALFKALGDRVVLEAKAAYHGADAARLRAEVARLHAEIARLQSGWLSRLRRLLAP
jgi:predicted O-methyltransferase YrrM